MHVEEGPEGEEVVLRRFPLTGVFMAPAFAPERPEVGGVFVVEAFEVACSGDGGAEDGPFEACGFEDDGYFLGEEDFLFDPGAAPVCVEADGVPLLAEVDGTLVTVCCVEPFVEGIGEWAVVT